ncbi:MAG: type II secretion system F family protein [Rhodocyclaceae bacterium]
MSTMQLFFLALLFLAVSGGVFGLLRMGLRRGPSGNRLNEAVGGVALGSAAADSAWLARMASLFRPLANLALPEAGWESSGLRVRLMNAGLRHNSVPSLYFAAKAGLALGFPAIFMFVLGVGRLSLESNSILFLVLLFASLGYYLPNFLLSWRVRAYQLELFEAFPDAMDLIIVCIEAGLGLDAAIARTGQEMRVRSPALAGELHLVTLELRVGVSREQALSNLATRTGLEEVGALVTMLRQADRFGTSIAESLRVHAEGLRTRRRQKAEEAAAKIPLKLLFPLIFCIFPSLLLVLLGPAFISIHNTLLKSMGGQ